MPDSKMQPTDTVWLFYQHLTPYWVCISICRQWEAAHGQAAYLMPGDKYALLETMASRMLHAPMIYEDLEDGRPPTDIQVYTVPPPPFAPGDVPPTEV